MLISDLKTKEEVLLCSHKEEKHQNKGVVLENIHTHPKEGHWKFWGKSKFFLGKVWGKTGNSREGGEGPNRKTILGVRMDIPISPSIYLSGNFSLLLPPGGAFAKEGRPRRRALSKTTRSLNLRTLKVAYRSTSTCANERWQKEERARYVKKLQF